jgi:Rps23 Pro-64 3,4-dihydroxylase Tpa1-like proline 4-hydroxylase
MICKKINNDYLQIINNTCKEDIVNKFGEWTTKLDTLKKSFQNAKPFEHIVIDNFLSDEFASDIYNLFPTDYENWHNYCNPLEVKFAYDDINSIDEKIKDYFYYLSSDYLVNLIKEITNIPNLEHDEYLHGAGLHSHTRHGRLNIHLDYEKHPISGKERRINIIYFTTQNWNQSWGGANELWDSDVKKCVKRTDIQFNRAIIFKTNEISWHGVHDKIMCPEGIFRKSLAYYYVSEFDKQKTESDYKEYREKAKFTKVPHDKYDENMEKLYKIREKRLLTKADLNEFMPNWCVES